MADRVTDSTASIRRGLNQHGCERIVLPSHIRVQSTKLTDISFVAYTDGLCPLCMVYQMAKEFATRRYQLTINNPKEHGYDHDTIKAILAKGAKLLYWCIKNQKEVNVMALGEGYTTHDVAWLDVKGGGRILPLPNVVYRISKPLPNGMVYLRKNKKCSRCAVPLQFVLDYVYQDLKQNHPQQQHIWDKKQRYKWDRQPITSEQILLIHKLAPDYKIDTKKMTRGDASRVIQLLAYAPKEQDAQEQAQEVQDDAT